MILDKYLKYILLHREQFIKYFVIGVSGTVLDILSLWILKEFFGLLPVVAVIVNQIFMLLYIFFLNKKISFKVGGIAHQQMIRFLIVAGGNYLFAILWMWLFNYNFGYNYLLVRIVNIILAVSWNFLLYREWVYKVTSDKIKVESL
ncbi:MAG: GtrA family protein [Candidatus Magasanikbacteria bacterium]|nr:GtrA family protein [Candidatus Magasanikbacteria bacterium]